jgi:methylated-DNA-protein-cysteine methyltransferase-like protein
MARTQEFDAQVYEIVRSIPHGHVMTYGQIAKLIPAPASIDPIAYRRIRARWVGYAMGDCPGDVPWQRVVNAQGRISMRPGHGPHVQRVLLEQEGVVISQDGRIDLREYLWELPDDSCINRDARHNLASAPKDAGEERS